MSYMVVSPYITPLHCMTLEAAEVALSLLVAVGGFGQILELPEEGDHLSEILEILEETNRPIKEYIAPEPVVFDPDAPIKVKNAVQPYPKPRGRPKKAQ